MAEFSTEERAVIERWILASVDSSVVPPDEGNDRALIYNLVHLVREGGARARDTEYQQYEYRTDQDAEIASWGLDV